MKINSELISKQLIVLSAWLSLVMSSVAYLSDERALLLVWLSVTIAITALFTLKKSTSFTSKLLVLITFLISILIAIA